MSARSTRGPGTGRVGGRRPRTRKGGGRGTGSSGCLPLIAVALVLGFAAILTPGLREAWSMSLAVPLTTFALLFIYIAISFVSPAARRSTARTAARPGSAPDGRARPAPALPSVSPRLWPDAGGETAGDVDAPRVASPAVTTTAAVVGLQPSRMVRGLTRASCVRAPASRPVSASPVTGRDVTPGGVR